MNGDGRTLLHDQSPTVLAALEHLRRAPIAFAAALLGEGFSFHAGILAAFREAAEQATARVDAFGSMMRAMIELERARRRDERRRYSRAHRGHRGRRRHVKAWIARQDFLELGRDLEIIGRNGGLVIVDEIG